MTQDSSHSADGIICGLKEQITSYGANEILNVIFGLYCICYSKIQDTILNVIWGEITYLKWKIIFCNDFLFRNLYNLRF